MNPQRISFARTFPVLALLLSYVIIAIPATMAYINVKSASRNGSDVIVRYHQVQLVISHDHFFRPSVQAGAEITSPTIQAINLPGHFIELAIATARRANPRTRSPFHGDSLAWRALIVPVCCLPFWWLVGVGLDALFRARQPRSWLLLSTSIFWMFFPVWISVYYFALSSLERTEMVYPIWSAWLWFALLSVFPIAWVKQALAWRRIRTSLQARLTAELQ